MNIEIVKTIEGSYCLWDGSHYLADCGKGVEGEKRAKAITTEVHRIQAMLNQARADAVQYRCCVEAVAHFWRNDPLAFGDEATPGTLAVRFAELGQLCCDTLDGGKI